MVGATLAVALAFQFAPVSRMVGATLAVALAFQFALFSRMGGATLAFALACGRPGLSVRAYGVSIPSPYRSSRSG